jgi:hypothetical protein
MNMRQAPPGFRMVRVHNGGQAFVANPTPGMDARSSGQAYQRTNALAGSHPTEPGEPSRHYPGMLEIPAFYTVSILLPGTDNAELGGSVYLRPEPFVARRITWCTQGDAPEFVSVPSVVGSAQGRCVEATWEDEFTKFLGNQPCLVSAMFGDSQGFLDFPKKGILFQGKQTLSVKLHRLSWPDPATTPATTRWDFQFQGVSLLPDGVNQSGSAG